MTAVGKWDVCLMEVITNDTAWALVTHMNGKEKLFRLSPATMEWFNQGEEGISRCWFAGIGIDFNWSDYENDGDALTKFLVEKEAMYQAAVTGNPYQDIKVTWL